MLMSVNAAVSGPSPVTQGDAYVLSLTASSTASTYTVNNWVLSYGDGTTHTLFGDSVADLTTYQNSGTYDITATVSDTEAGVSYSASATMSVVVDEATPTLFLSPGDGPYVGKPFDMLQEVDDGGEHTLSSMFIAWGDSSTDSNATLPQTFTSSFGEDFTHTYAAIGTYDVTATSTTEQGTQTATGEVTVVPLFYASDDGNGYTVGSEYDLTPTFSDPGATLSSYIVSWGDGSSDDTYSAAATLFTHTFASSSSQIKRD